MKLPEYCLFPAICSPEVVWTKFFDFYMHRMLLSVYESKAVGTSLFKDALLEKIK
jgi:hypothetical protein